MLGQHDHGTNLEVERRELLDCRHKKAQCLKWKQSLTGWSFDRQNVGAGQSTGMWWGTGLIKADLPEIGMNAYDPKIITVRYDGQPPPGLLHQWGQLQANH